MAQGLGYGWLDGNATVMDGSLATQWRQGNMMVMDGSTARVMNGSTTDGLAMDGTMAWGWTF